MIQFRCVRSVSRASAVSALACAAVLTGCTHAPTPNQDPPRWIDLFDGQSLTGWTQVNGEAPYTIVDGVIRGTNVMDSPNSFLATDTVYSDFVLEFDSRSIGDANSGVQFRTDLAPGTWSGVVGYQLDIDPTPRRWTGGIYHEGVHLWRHSMARNPACQAAYEHGAWNSYRIEAVGPVIATWVNDVACAHMVGDHHTAGFIALQVHAIGTEESLLGSFTEWRDVRLLTAPTPNDLWLSRRADLVEGWLEAEISDVESDVGWRSLDLTDDTARFEIGSGSFEIVIDMTLDEVAEGSLDYVIEQTGGACEGQYKLLNDVTLGGDRPATDLMGAVPQTHAAGNLSEPGRPKRIYADERANRVRILVTEDRIQHWLNSVKVVDYPRCAMSETSSGSNQMALRLNTQTGSIDATSAKYRVAQ